MPNNPLTNNEILEYAKRNKFPKGRIFATNPLEDSITGWYDFEEYLTDLGYSPSGETEKTWMDLVRGWKIEPTLNMVIAGGEVWNYVFQSSPSDVTYYRYIANDGSQDSFFETFSGGILTGLIASKQINV